MSKSFQCDTFTFDVRRKPKIWHTLTSISSNRTEKMSRLWMSKLCYGSEVLQSCSLSDHTIRTFYSLSRNIKTNFRGMYVPCTCIQWFLCEHWPGIRLLSVFYCGCLTIRLSVYLSVYHRNMWHFLTKQELTHIWSNLRYCLILNLQWLPFMLVYDRILYLKYSMTYNTFNVVKRLS